MKLLVVSNMYPNKNAPGYGIFVKNFCNQLSDLQINYSLAVMKKSRTKPGKLLGYVLFYLKSFLCCLFGSYDKVYIHYPSHSAPGVLLARKLRKFPIYTNIHGTDAMPITSEQKKMQRFTCDTLACSEKIIVPSAFFRDVILQKYQVCRQKVFVCPSGGVDTALFSPKEDKTIQHPVVFGFVSRLIPGKGWKVFLDACAKLNPADYRVVIAGDGPDKEALLQHIRNLSLEKTVSLQPFLSHDALSQLYQNIHSFVFPTQLQESLGLVALEAMCCGVPVIGSDCGALNDYMKDGQNGFCFPAGDADALAQCMKQFLDMSQTQYLALCQGALETACDYTRTKATETLRGILLEE